MSPTFCRRFVYGARVQRQLLALVMLSACEKDCPVPPSPAPCPPAPAPAPVPAASGDGVLDFVRIGYGDVHDRPARSLSFRTECLSTDIAKQAVLLVPSYNAFEGTKVAAAIESLRGELMCWQFGREGSPVLYAEIPYWTHQQEKACPTRHDDAAAECPNRDDARKLSVDERTALIARVKKALEAAQADEVGFETSSNTTLRAWWD